MTRFHTVFNFRAGQVTEPERGCDLLKGTPEQDVPVRELVDPADLGIPWRHAIDQDCPGFRYGNPCQQFQEGGLAAAVRADNRGDARRYPEIFNGKGAVPEVFNA